MVTNKQLKCICNIQTWKRCYKRKIQRKIRDGKAKQNVQFLNGLTANGGNTLDSRTPSFLQHAETRFYGKRSHKTTD